MLIKKKRETRFNETAMRVVMAPERIIKREGYIANLPWCQAGLTIAHCTGLLVLFIVLVNGAVMLIYFNYERLPHACVSGVIC